MSNIILVHLPNVVARACNTPTLSPSAVQTNASAFGRLARCIRVCQPPTDTRALVLATSFLVLGLQMLSAALFISIFSGRISRLAEEGSSNWSPS